MEHKDVLAAHRSSAGGSEIALRTVIQIPCLSLICLFYVILSQKNTGIDGIINENFREVMIWKPK